MRHDNRSLAHAAWQSHFRPSESCTRSGIVLFRLLVSLADRRAVARLFHGGNQLVGGDFAFLTLTTALSGMVTSALITPVTLVSADRTRLTHPTGHVIPVTLRWMMVSLSAGAADVCFESCLAADASAFLSWAKAGADSMSAAPMANGVVSRIVA